MNEQKPTHNIDEKYALALPCSPTDFGKFICSLLGKPQTITGSERGAFELRREDIVSSYHLVVQRVLQQNEAQIIQFVVRLVFDDNSSVLLNNLDDFLSYAEVRPVVVTQVHLSWSFLVQFRDRAHPEKQEVDLSFLTKPSGVIALGDDDETTIIPARLITGSQITFRIRHTARTWGADIESLLTGHAKHLILPQSTFRSFAQKHSGKLACSIALIFFVSTIAVALISADRIATEQLHLMSDLLQKTNAVDLKLNKLLQFSAEGFWGKYFFAVFIFTIFSLAASIGFGLWVEITADTKRPSYILLTKKSEQYKLEQDQRYRNRFYSFLFSLVVSVATGVISNILFAKYWAN